MPPGKGYSGYLGTLSAKQKARNERDRVDAHFAKVRETKLPRAKPGKSEGEISADKFRKAMPGHQMATGLKKLTDWLFN